MSRPTFPRLPWFGYVVVALTIPPHLMICYYVAEQRGYPPIDPYLENVWPYVFVLVPALFSGLEDREKWRWPLRLFFSLSFTIGVSMIIACEGQAIPRSGIHWEQVAVWAAIYFIPIFVFSRCLDSVAGSVWALVRKLPPIPQLGDCLECGYDLRGTIAAKRTQCPECGVEFQIDLGNANQPKR